MARTHVPTAEFEDRIETVRDKLAAHDLDGLCLFSSTSIEWVSGFYHLQTERPVCLAVTPATVAITVPRLEYDRATSDKFPTLDHVYHYYDYPGGDGTYPQHPQRTPEATIAEMLTDLGVDTVAADSNGAPGHWGYQGPALDAFAPVTVEQVDWITDLRTHKSPVEIDLLETSATWGNLAHEKLTEYATPGRHELWVAQRASLDASLSMLDALGERYESHLRGGLPAHAGFLAGPNTARPHGLTANRRLQAGDVLVTGASANVGGYVSELERTMFLGDPDSEDRHYFQLMHEAQSIAIDTSGPGVRCSRVDQAVHDYFDEQGVLEYAQHHTGHNIGLEGHERDFIDRGSETVMEPGHVYTIEPGLYVPDRAGYRHSDTIYITDDGVEPITYYPRSLDANIIPLSE